MVVVIVDEYGQFYQCIVLFKYYDEKGMVFYINFGSCKVY